MPPEDFFKSCLLESAGADAAIQMNGGNMTAGELVEGVAKNVTDGAPDPDVDISWDQEGDGTYVMSFKRVDHLTSKTNEVRVEMPISAKQMPGCSGVVVLGQASTNQQPVTSLVGHMQLMAALAARARAGWAAFSH